MDWAEINALTANVINLLLQLTLARGPDYNEGPYGLLQVGAASSKSRDAIDKFVAFARSLNIQADQLSGAEGYAAHILVKTEEAARLLVRRYKMKTGIDITPYIGPSWYFMRFDKRPDSAGQFVQNKHYKVQYRDEINWALRHKLLTRAARVIDISYGDQPGMRLFFIRVRYDPRRGSKLDRTASTLKDIKFG